MSQGPNQALLAALAALQHPVTGRDTQGVEEITGDLHEALLLLGRESDGGPSPVLAHWREYFAEREQRLYYCNDEIGYNSWDPPPCFKFREWSLDSQLYGISVRLARDIYQALDALLARHPPPVAFKALAMLATLAGNAAGCGNTVEKFRIVKVENPKFRAAVWDLPGTAQVLFLAGFRHQGEALTLPADAPLGPLRAAAARLRRLADRKGHSGEAVLVRADGGDGSGRPPSPFYGQPGFKYQTEIWHCSLCDHPINDGSERLWTGKVDAPHGEYRYECSTCRDAGATFNLCQDCWDQWQGLQNGGASSSSSSSRAAGASPRLQPHLAHAFQHVGPKLTRHGAGSGSDDTGWRRGAPVPARALQRLSERTGVRHWG